MHISEFVVNIVRILLGITAVSVLLVLWNLHLMVVKLLVRITSYCGLPRHVHVYQCIISILYMYHYYIYRIYLNIHVLMYTSVLSRKVGGVGWGWCDFAVERAQQSFNNSTVIFRAMPRKVLLPIRVYVYTVLLASASTLSALPCGKR